MSTIVERMDKIEEEYKSQLLYKLQINAGIQGVIHNLSKTASFLDKQDIEGEFWHGVLKALPKVKNIGNPIAHLIQMGVWQVKSAIREELNRNIVQECLLCGGQNTKYSYNRKCKKCDESVENIYRNTPHDESSDARMYLDSISKIEVESIRIFLNKNEIRVLDALLVSCNENPESPIIYASKLLNISRQRIHQMIKKIRDTLQKKSNERYF